MYNSHVKCFECLSAYSQSKEEGKDKESIQSNTTLTQDTIQPYENVTKTQENIRYMKASPAGDQKATANSQDSMTYKHKTQITKRIHKRSTALERSVRKLLEGLNMFVGASHTLISDVDQDK